MSTAETVGLALDWRRHRVNAEPRACRCCHEPAYMTDERGVPCHKVCAEIELERRAMFHARRPREA